MGKNTSLHGKGINGRDREYMRMSTVFCNIDGWMMQTWTPSKRRMCTQSLFLASTPTWWDVLPLRVQFHRDRMALHPTIGGTLFPFLPIASTLLVGSVALEIPLERHPWWPRDGGLLPRGRGGPRSRMREIEGEPERERLTDRAS